MPSRGRPPPSRASASLIGIAGGRWAWRVFATQLGVLPEPAPSRSSRSSSPFPAPWRWRTSSRRPRDGRQRAPGPPPVLKSVEQTRPLSDKGRPANRCGPDGNPGQPDVRTANTAPWKRPSQEPAQPQLLSPHTGQTRHRRGMIRHSRPGLVPCEACREQPPAPRISDERQRKGYRSPTSAPHNGQRPHGQQAAQTERQLSEVVCR